MVFDKYNETVFASNLRVVYICTNKNTTALSTGYLTYQICISKIDFRSNSRYP